ncbi:hypothetical protein B0H17DRAFT_1145526 [Mycena rosella]|uniref:Uncharacterized protein n=1 Tax=Mycena rosella TaxID=1033263 RepID=A0AAD7CQW7_MYCRO|nr:hypothetical protein B0H17DRAFT_1145526 [Mycena rosella]
MDEHYNHQAAAKALDTWTESMKNTDTSREYMHQAAFIDPSFYGVKKTDDKTTKVVYSQDGTRAEAIFTMIGALKAYDIPPVKKNRARAYPELVRYDSKHFAAAMDKVKDLTYTLSGFLSQIATSRHLGECISHCLDNDVTYLCFKKRSGFRVGDIVEMGFPLVAFRQPTRGEEDKQICKVVLRTLTLLDDPTAKVSTH